MTQDNRKGTSDYDLWAPVWVLALVLAMPFLLWIWELIVRLFGGTTP